MDPENIYIDEGHKASDAEAIRGFVTDRTIIQDFIDLVSSLLFISSLTIDLNVLLDWILNDGPNTDEDDEKHLDC